MAMAGGTGSEAGLDASVADARQVIKLWLANNGEGQQQSRPAQVPQSAEPVKQEAESESEFDLHISTVGKLGLSLGPADTEAGPQLLQVVAVATGGAAEVAAASRSQRLRAGLVVVRVMGRAVMGDAPSAIMGMIKAAGRPLTLTLRPHPDEVKADVAPATDSGGRAEASRLFVLSDLPLVHSHLRHPRFRVLPLREWDGSISQLMDEKVDVLFVGRHIADFQALPSTLLVNQFVGESCVTSKLLVQEMLLRNTPDRARPAWLPEQYVVPDQRVALLSAWDRRQAKGLAPTEAGGATAPGGLHNSWIVRSGWGARSEGVWVTDSRARLTELAEAAQAENRKWVVSRYVAAPALIDSRKFDLRFYVAVRRAGSAQKSPEIFIHKEFYCRRAIDRYSGSLQRRDARQQVASEQIEQPVGADSSAVCEKDAFPATEHLTVHCYSEDADARAGQVFYSAAEFRNHWAIDHGYGGTTEAAAAASAGCGILSAPGAVNDVFGPELASIRRAIAELFSCAACEMGDPELWPSSRGLYGIDVMLEHAQEEHQLHHHQEDDEEDEHARTAATGPRPLAYSAVILEANYSPDTTRMLQYHPSFYDEVFSCLFLNHGGTDGDLTAGAATTGLLSSNEGFLPLHAC